MLLAAILVHTEECIPPSGADSMLSNTFIVYRHLPEPASDKATVAYELRKPAVVTVKLYSNLGTLMSTQSLGMRPVGSHSVVLDVSDFDDGRYYYLIEADGAAAIRGITVLKPVHGKAATETAAG
jgi:hypothetical protein